MPSDGAVEANVVVAGGGPAGLQFARAVGRRSDRRVVVLEANERLADNDKSTGGTFTDLVEGYDVPETVLMDSTSGVTFEAPGASETIPIPAYVLDFPAFLEFLGDDAESAGVDVRTGARVLAPIREDGRVVGVTYRRGGAERDLRADVAVDATGPAGTLVSQIGLFDPGAGPLAVGKEYEVAGCHDLDALLFRFDHDAAPGGYAWTFPAGDGVFKAGVCWYVDQHDARVGTGNRPTGDGDRPTEESDHPTGDGDRPIDEYVRDWIAGDDRWEDGAVRAVHAGKAAVTGAVRRRVTDGLVAVGDTVATINPVFGEGIRPGLESAEMAADAVLDALAAGDPSRERLAAYEERWNAARGRHWRRQRLVGELLYEFGPDQQRRFVENVGRLSPPQWERFRRYEPTLRDLLALYPFSLQDARQVPKLLDSLREGAAARLR
ncbi:MAG: NAD(P)/FAD-dependent oxidoreductase [Haloarculaceae archaeon]